MTQTRKKQPNQNEKIDKQKNSAIADLANQLRKFVESKGGDQEPEEDELKLEVEERNQD